MKSDATAGEAAEVQRRVLAAVERSELTAGPCALARRFEGRQWLLTPSDGRARCD